jgi:acetylornithine/N-succinyldiaminopimelate aminotransferase
VSRFFWYPGHELVLPNIVRAEGSHLVDADGKRYVDLESGVWCTSIGHAHPGVLRTITEQAARIGHTGFNYSNPIVDEVAQELLTLLGFADGKCVFLCSGSEAVEYGVRIAQTVAKRPLLLTMADSYFGAYGSASRKQPCDWFVYDWLACPRCSTSGMCDERCEQWSAIPHERIGGFLFEPGSSMGLVRFPPQKLIDRIVDLVRKNDGLILVNEVTTGVGRTGAWFGHQHYGISPDIVALGKGIGNGYPVSVAVVGSRAVERLGGEPVKYAQSHQNDPVGAAVVREVLRVIREEGLIERGREIAIVLMKGLERIKDRCRQIKEVRGRGLMMAIEFLDDEANSFTTRVHREIISRGFVVGRRPGARVLRIDPSLTVDRSDIEAFLAALDLAVTGTANDA